MSVLKNSKLFGKRITQGKKRYHYQCATPRDHGEIQLFRKFQIFADEGPRRKTEKFWQIEKIIGDLYDLDNFKQKIFFEKKISKSNSKCHFSTDFEQS